MSIKSMATAIQGLFSFLWREGEDLDALVTLVEKVFDGEDLV